MISFSAGQKFAGLCLALALVQGAIFVGVQYHVTGALSFPLDDSYIHLQYGKQIAQGHYFHYQDHDPVTGGATSYLYVHLLAAGYLIGFRGVLYLIWAHLIAFAGLAATLGLLVRIGERLGSARAGWSAAVLTLLSGLMAWTFWSGMEIALFVPLLLLVFYLLLEPEPLNARLLTAMGFLALCRPEGAIVSIVIFALVSVQRHSLQVLRNAGKRFWSALSFLAASIAGPSLFLFFTTGKTAGNGLLAKGILYHPTQTFFEKIETIASNFIAIVSFLLGRFDIHPVAGEFVIPGMLLFSLVGLAGLWRSDRKDGGWRALIFGAPIGIVLMSISTIEVWPLHNFRYLTPFFPVLTLLGLLGLETILKYLRLEGRTAFNTAAITIFLFVGIHLPVWAARFAANSTTVYEKQIKAAWWIGTLLPSDRPVAINDAGALVFYNDGKTYPGLLPFNSQHDFIDLIGLVDNETTIAYRMGEGGLYEALQRLPADRRPMHAAIFPTWFEQSSQVYDFFRQPLVTFPDPFDETFGKTVFQINWNYTGKEDHPREKTMKDGWMIRDSLDVGDLVSEAEHGYEFTVRDKKFPKNPVPFRRNFGYHEEIDERWPGIENEIDELIPVMQRDGTIYDYDIVDTGRRIDGEERFTLHNLTPGQNAFLILRTCDTTAVAPRFSYRMDLFSNDIYIDAWTASGTPWNWYETVFTLPAEAVTDTSLRIRIVNRGTRLFTCYESFYYWVCQTEPTESLFFQ